MSLPVALSWRNSTPQTISKSSPSLGERKASACGAFRVSSAENLAWAIAGLLDEPARLADMGRRARALVEAGQGAIERHLKIIAARLSMTSFARAAG